MTLQVARARHSDGRETEKARGVPARTVVMPLCYSRIPFSADRESVISQREAVRERNLDVVPNGGHVVLVRGDAVRLQADAAARAAVAVRRDARVRTRAGDRCRPDVVVETGGIAVECDTVGAARLSVSSCRLGPAPCG
jgi:hypothetical protein